MKKLLVVFLSIILLLAVLPITSVSAAKQPIIVVSNEKANVGDTVKVTVSVENNPGIISMRLLIKYDSQALKLIDAKVGDFASITFGPTTKNPFTATWIEPLKPNDKTNGVFTTLSFEVLDTSPNGKSAVTVSYDPEDVFEITSNKDFANVDFAIQNGYVDITNSNASTTTTTSSNSSTTSQTSSGNAKPNTNSSIAISGDVSNEETTNQQASDAVDSSSQNQTSSQQNIATDENIADELTSTDTITPTDTITTGAEDGNAPNNMIIWGVVAALIVVLAGAFVIVVIKSKKK